MATETQREQLRLDTGTDETSLTNDEIDDIYTAAATLYDDSGPQDAYARVVVFRRLLAQAAPRASYKQNQSSESVSDLFDHYKQMLAYWEGKLKEEIAAVSANGKMRWGTMKKTPTRLEEYPDA